jgi:hypothetical protein
MSELAFNLNGEPFDLPLTATGWRVRKFKSKGAPEVVYGREGTPLVLPIDADMADLRREARSEGRYRLDAIDEHSRPIAGAPPPTCASSPPKWCPRLPRPSRPRCAACRRPDRTTRSSRRCASIPIRTGFVIRNLDGSGITDNATKYHCYRLCRAAGLPERGWHILRYAFGTHAAMIGVDPVEVDAGHRHAERASKCAKKWRSLQPGCSRRGASEGNYFVIAGLSGGADGT